MGKPGPNPTPTAILEARGAWRARERRSEPESDGCPEPMYELSDGAREVWDRVLPRLDQMGVLGSIDTESLSLFCTSFAQWLECQRVIRSEGMTYEKALKDGSIAIVERPEMNRAHRLMESCIRLMGDFGMTPSARASIGVALGRKKKEAAQTDPRQKHREKLGLAS